MNPTELKFAESIPSPKWETVDEHPNLDRAARENILAIVNGEKKPASMREGERSAWNHGIKIKGAWFNQNGILVRPDATQLYGAITKFFTNDEANLVEVIEEKEPFGGMSFDAAKQEYDAVRATEEHVNINGGRALMLFRASTGGKVMGVVANGYPFDEDIRTAKTMFDAWQNMTEYDFEDFMDSMYFKRGSALARLHAAGLYSVQPNPTNWAYREGEVHEMDIETLLPVPEDLSDEERNELFAMDLCKLLQHQLTGVHYCPLINLIAGYMSIIGNDERRTVVNKINGDQLYHRLDRIEKDLQLFFATSGSDYSGALVKEMSYIYLLKQLKKIGGKFQLPPDIIERFFKARYGGKDGETRREDWEATYQHLETLSRHSKEAVAMSLLPDEFHTFFTTFS